MPSGTCDPASRGQTYNEVTLASGNNGDVVVTYRFGWDGVSTFQTGCVGPLLYLSGTNNSETTTYYAHFQGRRGQWRKVALEPGETMTEDRPQRLRALGFDDSRDVEGLLITADPNPPDWTARR